MKELQTFLNESRVINESKTFSNCLEMTKYLEATYNIHCWSDSTGWCMQFDGLFDDPTLVLQADVDGFYFLNYKNNTFAPLLPTISIKNRWQEDEEFANFSAKPLEIIKDTRTESEKHLIKTKDEYAYVGDLFAYSQKNADYLYSILQSHARKCHYKLFNFLDALTNEGISWYGPNRNGNIQLYPTGHEKKCPVLTIQVFDDPSVKGFKFYDRNEPCIRLNTKVIFNLYKISQHDHPLEDALNKRSKMQGVDVEPLTTIKGQRIYTFDKENAKYLAEQIKAAM